MRRGIGFMATLVFAVTAFVVFTGTASAGRSLVDEWLTPNCNGVVSETAWENWAWDEYEECDEDSSYPFVTICVNGTSYDVYTDDDPVYISEMVDDINNQEGYTASLGYCPNAPPPQGPDRYIYCAGAGDVGADGKPLGLGQTLNLKFGEQVGSQFFPNATLGFWVKSVGLTCQLTPEQAALAAASTTKVNHTGAANTQEGAQVYTFVNA